MFLLFLFIGGVSASGDLNDTLKSDIDDGNVLNINEDVGVPVGYADENQAILENTDQVSKSVPEMSVNTTVDGNTAFIDVYLPKDATGLVLADVDSIMYAGRVENGNATIVVPRLTPGNYVANVSYLGDDNYAGATASDSFAVREKGSSYVAINYIRDSTYPGKADIDLIIFNATTTLFVVMKSDLSIIYNETVVYDESRVERTIKLSNLQAGEYFVIVNNYENENYTDSYAYERFTVNKADPYIHTDIIRDFENYSKGVIIKVNVLGNATGKVMLSIDGEVISQMGYNLINGSVNITVPSDFLTEGRHSYLVTYNGDDNYNADMAYGTFNIDVLPSKFDGITISGDLNISATLIDGLGNPISNATITYAIGDVNGTTVTDDNGLFSIRGVGSQNITIYYAGENAILPTSLSLTLIDVAKPFVDSHFNITGGVITLNGYAVDTKAGEEGMSYATELLDSEGKPIKGVKIQFAVNDKIYTRNTNENGSFTPYKLNMVRAGRYTMAFFFAGDDKYSSAFASVCVDLDKKPITIKASAKTYKASATKSYTVSLSTIVGSSADGKAHLSSGKKVTLHVNGKVYTGKTNDNGQVTFKLTNLSKKGVYDTVINFAGDNTYESASKTVKITVN